MNEQILANIKAIMTNTSLSESFYETVLERLVSFGYNSKEGDAWVICFSMQKIENHIKNYCNIDSVPDGLFNIAVDMVCGDFLFTQKNTGNLELTDLDLDGAISSIKEGDTQVNFGSGSSDEDKLIDLINYLLNNGSGELLCYRKIRW